MSCSNPLMRTLVSLLSVILLGACASSGSTNGNTPDGAVAGSGGSAGSASAGGSSGSGGSGGSSGVGSGNDLSAQIEELPSATAVEVVTIDCDGVCKRVRAVGSGGNDPYRFVWSDGVTTAEREVCGYDDGTLMVSVSDTPIDDGEFPYPGQTVTAGVSVHASTSCGDDGGVDASLPLDDAGFTPLCTQGTSPPFQLMMKVPTAPTATFTQVNGTLTDYRDSTVVGLTIVSAATIAVDLGNCGGLSLAGDAAGTRTLGWDNVLLIEYRPTPRAAVEHRWYYGPQSMLTHVPTGELLEQPLSPTVSGLLLDPQVPNPVPFGYEPHAIELMNEVPSGARRFELKLYVVDSGGFGSTSEIWAIPH